MRRENEEEGSVEEERGDGRRRKRERWGEEGSGASEKQILRLEG